MTDLLPAPEPLFAQARTSKCRALPAVMGLVFLCVAGLVIWWLQDGPPSSCHGAGMCFTLTDVDSSDDRGLVLVPLALAAVLTPLVVGFLQRRR